MQTAVPLACFLSLIRPPGVQYESALLQVAPVDKDKCPYVRAGSDVAFQLYTRHNPTAYQELMLDDDERLFASNMDFHAPTVLYFHAFMEQPDDGSGIMVREAYMQRGDTNVIMVAAPRLEAGPWYFTAAQNTWYIGRYAASFIDYMVTRGLQLNSTHLVGHSLGAQAAGVAGTALTTGRVSRITGLDPALPLFAGLPPQQRLDKSDADFVDVIHTDAGIFGWKEPIGHADFFPNGGKSPQPGCELEVVIPQQLLLNKCDGKEQTRGFYSYYLRPNADYRHESRECSSVNQEKQIQTVSNRMKLELPTAMLISKHASSEQGKQPVGPSTHKQNKLSQISSDEEEQKSRDFKYFTTSYNILRKKRVKRIVKTINTKSNDLPEEREPRSYTRPSVQHITVTDAADTTSNNDPHKLDDDTQPDHSNNASTTDADVSGTNDSNHDTHSLANKHTADAHSHHELITHTNEAKQTTGSGPPHAEQQASIDKTNRGKSNQRKTSTTTYNGNKHADRNAKKRQKRFLQFFRSENDDNFIFRALNFLVRNGKSVVPIISVVRDINTLVKSGNGELSHVTRETNKYVGITPPPLTPLSYTLELAGESRVAAFLKRLVGLTPKGDRLTIGSG